MIRALCVLLALCGFSGAALADPFSAIATLATFAGAAAGTGYFLTLSASTWLWIGVAASALGAIDARRKSRKATAKARADYNAGLQDRTVSVLRTDPPWQVVYGRAIVGGAILDIVTNDKPNARRENGAAYTKPDAYKTIVQQVASHEVEAIHEVYIDGVPVGPIDANGIASTGASATVTFTHTTDRVNWTATPAANGVGFLFFGGTAPTGLTPNRLYFVRDKEANSFRLAESPGGAPVAFSSDGSGTITGRLQSPFFSQREDSRQVTFTNSVTISEPLVQVFSAYTGTGDAQEPVSVTIVGNQLVSGTPDVEVTCNYSVTMDTPTVRISKQLGSATQATNAVLAEIAPARYTSDHRLRAIAYVVVTLDIEDERFQGGPPNITADVSGRKVFDPRTSTTAWSDNPALCIRDFLTAPWGFEVDAADVDDASVIVAANACDELIDLTVGTTTETDRPRYTCNGAFVTEGAYKESVLEDLVDSMAGMVTYSAKWRLLAGAWSASVMTLTDDDLHGQIEVVQADTPMSELFNGIRGQLFLAGAQSPSDFNPYSNSVFVTDDGRELWTTVQLNWTNHLARARNLCRIMVEKNRAGQVIRYPAKLKAWPLQIGDRVTVTSSEYGITSKLYRVTDWAFDAAGAVDLTLQEDAAELYDEADAAVPDPTPNTDLADPWAVPALTGLTATSGGATLLLQGDGTVVPRVLVEWDPITAGNVLGGGAVEVLWRSQTTTTWVPTQVAGSEVDAWLEGVTEGDVILIEARAVNALGRRGPSTFLVHTVVGKTAAPAAVTGLDWAIKPGQVQVYWDPCPDIDYAYTELRVGASWATADFLWRGAASEYHHPRPPNGTYTVLAKHVDTSGNESTTAASISVTVDDSIDPGTGAGARIQLTTDRGPYFVFADGTTHTSASPAITFTAALLNAAGDVTWTARAFNASNVDIGAVTLGGTAGLVRTLSAAQFVAAGVSGSVRTVIVTVTHPTAGSDSLTVFRRDPTTTTPAIFLANPQATVPTDVNGLNGDYSDASTTAQVITGLTDETALYTLSITADPGITATINGGAGPVTGTASVTVAVTDSTIDDGYVEVSAARSGWPTLMAAFRVSKSKGSGGLRIYWDPRSEIVLPVGADGAVSSYADAWSTLQIDREDGFSDVNNWSMSAAYTNVVGTLSGNRVDVTGLVALGASGGTAQSATIPSGIGWNLLTSLAYDRSTGVWVATGVQFGGPVAHSKVLTSSDFINWTVRDVGLSKIWRYVVFAKGAFVLVDENFGHSVRRSVDGGVTWSAGGALSAAGQIVGAWSSGNTIILSSYSGPGSQRSTDGGVTWSSLALPNTVMSLYPGGPNEWIARDSAGPSNRYRSTDDGTSWSNINAQTPDNVWHAMRFKGRTFITYWFDGVAASPRLGYVTPSGTIGTITLPASYSRGGMAVVDDVLYIQYAGGFMYSADGVTFRVGTLAANANGLVGVPGGHSGAFLPLVGSPTFVKQPLAASSEDTGAVTVTARQAGQPDIVRTLIVRKATPEPDVFAFGASPGQLNLPATDDGVVTSWTSASVTALILRNGVDDAAIWSISWTAANMTPASGTGATATFTGMATGATTSAVVYRATRAGYADVTGSVPVIKVPNGLSSGYRQGASFMVVDTANTYLGLRFRPDGWVQVKRGSGGSWVNYVAWSGAPGVAGVGAGTWLYVYPEAGAPALLSGTLETWLQLSADREYILQNTTPGVHTWRAAFLFSNSSSGTNPLAASGGLQLIVP